ncbi:VWA domain-containing protein [Fusobacterium pseudoperiodonticum]
MNNINIGLIVDRSGSVENEKIALENSINLLIESFKRKYKESINLNVLLVILESDDLSIQDNNLKNINLEKIGLKDKSIKEILEIIEEKFEKLEGDKKIILFSDGYFEDEDNRFLNQRKRSKENEIEYISVGIGEGYRKIILEKFSTNGVIFEYQDIYDFI